MLIVFYIEDEDLQGSQRREDNRGQWAGAWGGGGRHIDMKMMSSSGTAAGSQVSHRSNGEEMSEVQRCKTHF